MKLPSCKFISPFLYLVSLSLLLSSCDKEENKPDNHILFNGKKYVINTATLKYAGEVDLRYLDRQIGKTHYEYSIQFSDGIIDPQNSSHITNATYLVTFSVYATMADHSLDLTGGTFTGVHPQEVFGGRAPLDKNFYSMFILRVDDNGNGAFNQNETWADGIEGEVVMTGSDNKFTVTIDTSDAAANVSIDGRYEGIFEVRL